MPKSGEVDVRIRFKQRIVDYVKERTWHPSQEITGCENGDAILSMTVNHLLELKRWVLSWGADAQVLKPDHFAQDIIKTINKASDQYHK
jgi:predicted DNA-binding transcriptional regulator YafY